MSSSKNVVCFSAYVSNIFHISAMVCMFSHESAFIIEIFVEWPFIRFVSYSFLTLTAKAGRQFALNISDCS